MSSPLSSLKKSKRPMNSLQGNGVRRNVPFRNAEYSADEAQLLEEITGEMAASKLRGAKMNAGGMPKTGPSDADLMGLMMTRLSVLEQRIQSQAKQISEKDKTIRILEEKVSILRDAKGEHDANHVQDLQNKCLLLQRHVHEMEAFLSDYGMIWVGASDEAAASENSQGYNAAQGADNSGNKSWRPADSVVDDSTLKVDYDLIMENIKELNVLAGEGMSHIHHTVDGARLKMNEDIPLTLFANGIFMFEGPFRPFTDATTRTCVQDFMDGFFPSELQDKYPDGVVIKVTDRREVHFKDDRSNIFQGPGVILGGDSKPSRLVPSSVHDHTEPAQRQKETSQRPGRRVGVEQFLNKLPANVIKEGKVIDIRSGIGNILQVSGEQSQQQVTVVKTETVLDMKARMEGDRSGRQTPTKDVTTLRILSENRDHTYILKMKATDTISTVRRYLNDQRSKKSPPYEIMSTFPSRVLEEGVLSLRDLGLCPNATLQLRPSKQR